MSKTLTLGSLFDGIGGFPLAGMKAGIQPIWASEIEPFPIRVTTKRLPGMRHLGDIHAIHGGEIEPVDIITFGSPCQNYPEEPIIPKCKPPPLHAKDQRAKPRDNKS